MFCLIQDGGIQDGLMKLKMAKSQLLLNQLRWCFKVHSSIDPMESGKLLLVNYFWKIQDGDIQDGVPLLSCVHAPRCPCSYIRPAAIFEGDIDNSRFTTVQPPRNHCLGGRRLRHVCGFASERFVH